MKIFIKLLLLVSLFFAPLLVSAQAFDQNLYFGLRNNPDVEKLQEFLTDQGVYSGPITGNFFSLTLVAVKKFQSQNNISPAAGFFGPLTRIKVNDILSVQLNASNQQAITETGTVAPPTTQNPTTNSSQQLIQNLQNQILAFQQQLAQMQQQNQTTQNQQTQIQSQQTQIQQNQQNQINSVQQQTTQQTNQQTSTNQQSDTQSQVQIISVDISPDFTSARFEWQTSVPTNSKVFISGGSLSSKIFTSLSGISTRHVADISGLVPDMNYSYEIEAIFENSIVVKKTGTFRTSASSFSFNQKVATTDREEWTATATGEPYLIEAITVSANNLELRQKLYPGMHMFGSTQFQFRECQGLESVFKEYSNISYPYDCPGREIKTPDEYQSALILGYSIASKDWMGRSWYPLSVPVNGSVTFTTLPKGTKFEFIKAVGVLSGKVVIIK